MLLYYQLPVRVWTLSYHRIIYYGTWKTNLCPVVQRMDFHYWSCSVEKYSANEQFLYAALKMSVITETITVLLLTGLIHFKMLCFKGVRMDAVLFFATILDSFKKKKKKNILGVFRSICRVESATHSVRNKAWLVQVWHVHVQDCF